MWGLLSTPQVTFPPPESVFGGRPQTPASKGSALSELSYFRYLVVSVATNMGDCKGKAPGVMA